MLEQFEVTDQAHQHGGQLGSGQCTRVALAKSLINEPELLATIRALRPSRVLDLGCGEGSHVDLPGFPALAEVYPDAEIVGYEPGAAAPAPYPTCHRGGLPLPEADASFELIAAINVLEHAHNLEPLLAEMRRLLAPGGHLLVAVPEGRAIGDRLYRLYTLIRHRRQDHLRAWSLEQWRQAIHQGTGLRYLGAIDKQENLVWAPEPLAGAGRAALRLAARHFPQQPQLFCYGYLMLWEAR